MAQNPSVSKNQVAFVAAGAVIGLCVGYLFFHDDGDSFIAGWLPAIILSIAAAFVAYFLAKPNASGR